MPYPLIGVCQVVSRSVKPWGVYVLNPSLQSTGVLVRPVMNGSADALRVSQKALPTEGTWGLVAWPYGDSRNGIWLGALYTQQADALLEAGADVDYEAHPSGAWDVLDSGGNYIKYFPDGSFLQVGSPSGASVTGATISDSGVTGSPTTTRHVVNSAQVQTNVAYANSSRQSSTASAKPVAFSHSSGTSFVIGANGNIKVTHVSGAIFNIDSSGNVNIEPVGSVNIMHPGGTATEHLPLAEALVAAFNAHTHTAQGSAAATTTPIQQMSVSGIGSTIVKVQE